MKRLIPVLLLPLSCDRIETVTSRLSTPTCGLDSSVADTGAGGTEGGDAASDATPDAPPSGPTCDDGIANGTETDIDCGGDVCQPCAPGYSCVATSDCGEIPDCTEADCQAKCVNGLCDPIKHVVVIVQENRSLCQYFATFAGVTDCELTRTIPDPRAPGGVASPWHDTLATGPGGPHERTNSLADINGGAMDGFCTQVEGTQSGCCANAACRTGAINILGYRDATDLPNYHYYASWGVLHDAMFSGVSGASLANHQEIVANWAANCPGGPMTCVPDPSYNTDPATKNYQHTSMMWLLGSHGVTWAYYAMHGAWSTYTTCSSANAECPPNWGVGGCSTEPQKNWLVADDFDDVGEIGQTANSDVHLNNFYTSAHNGTLPTVSWIAAPNHCVSEHQPRSLVIGQKYVTGLLNTIGRSSVWATTAVFLYWDDWGGYWDWKVPPVIDGVGYGIRVPSIVVSAYVKAGVVDHTAHSFDSVNRFIEDRFVAGQRIDATCGRPDSRPNVRETLANPLDDNFDFKQPARPAPLRPQ